MKLIFSQNSHHPNTHHPKPKKPIAIDGVGNLPCDLIIEILARLPVKTLCKFRCVSKQWLYLLSLDKSFVTRHREESKKSPLLLSRKYSSGEKGGGGEVYKVNIELTSMAMEGNILNKLKASICGPIYTFTSCGPLLVLCCTDCAYVCNPGCQEFVPLPRSASVFTSFNVGFGYICNSNEYKVVHLFNLDPFNSAGLMGCEVFTLRDGDGVINSGDWRRVQDCAYRVHTNCSAICVDGFLYWKIREQGNESSTESILSFDLEREEFRVINYPKCYIDSDQKVLFLTGFKGSLCLVDCSSKSTMEMWLLKGNGQNRSCWVKEYCVNLHGLDAKIEIKGLVPSIEAGGEILMNTEQKGLVYYNPENKVFRRVENSGMVEWYKKPCLYYDGFFSLHRK